MRHFIRLSLMIGAFGAALPACDKGGSGSSGTVIAIDGSSTVFPINEAMAEEFQRGRSERVTIGVSGTGGGFKKLCNKEVALVGASRPIAAAEVEACKKNGVAYIELPVAYDGIAVAVSPDNDWVAHMTVEELKKIWSPEAQGKVTKWSQIREGWPDKELHLFGAGVDSGTYDYFTQAIVGKEHSSRGDFTSSEDDNILVQGVASDPVALGFFGYAYYEQNKGKLKLVPIDDGRADNGEGPIAPTPETIGNSTYQPLSRPIFIYLSKEAAEREEVKSFITFYLENAAELVPEVGYVPLPAKVYALAAKRFEQRTTGSVYEGGGSQVGVAIEDLLESQK
jgi:phosphate transport system substrate-binding protein